MKESYNIFKCVLFKIFKKFEKVVRGWKNWEKWGKMSAPESPIIHYYSGDSFSQLVSEKKFRPVQTFKYPC